MKKKLIVIILSVALSLSMIGTAYAEVEKSETIYVKLNYDGSVHHITAVNRLYGTTSEDKLTDYGYYKNVKSLEDNTIGVINDNKVVWPSSVLDDDFYYEGDIDAELPYTYQIMYYLDGKIIDPSDLAGKDGEFKLVIIIEDNDSYKNDLSLSSQISVQLDLDKFSDIQVNNGTSVTVGKTMTLNYMLLPNQSGRFTLEANGKNIELNPITITMVPYSVTLPTDLEEGLDGLKEMEEGTDELLDKTKMLEDGLKDITNGIKEITDGSSSLKGGIEKVSGGLDEVGNGTSGLKSKVSQLTETSNELSLGLSTANGSSGELVNGYNNLKTNLDASLEMSDQMIESANKMIESGVPEYVQLGQQLLAQVEGLKQMALKMEQLNYGLTSYVTGITTVEEGLKAFDQQAGYLPSGVEQLELGLDALNSGIGDLSNGIDTLYDGAKDLKDGTEDLPENAGKLVNGQQELKDGITTMHNRMEEELESFTDTDQSSVSFIEPSNPMKTDVQIIIQTPSIKSKEVKVVEKVEEKKKTLWDRIIDLFR